MMDRILKSLLADFTGAETENPDNLSEEFERFVNYSIIYGQYGRDFDLDTVTIGSGDDTGIDGLAIIVNGQLVEGESDIEVLLASNNYIELTYIFIQAKTSASFSTSDMNNFAYGVKDFFAESPKLRRNADVQQYAKLSDYLLTKKAPAFRDNPKCKLYYVTAGTWRNDQNHVAIIETTKADLESLALFSEIVFEPVGSDGISKLYRATKSVLRTTFTFSEKITLPELPQIREAYYGIIPFYEFKKLLVDENNHIRNVFYDNVRDFQGINNSTNKDIAATLDGVDRDLFTVLNNGITVVAASLKSAGNKFTIEDYQIVNGCQTSSVLYDYLGTPEIQNLNIPIRLIVTEIEEVKNQITVATNSQTAIQREQLQAMTMFQKKLELYYQTFTGDGRLYYERRTKQYQSENSISKTKVISILTQMKAFGSMFLDIPHRVTTYVGSVINQNVESKNPTIFNPNHQLIPYYASALAYHRLDYYFRSKTIDTKYRRVKFFVLMVFRHVVNRNSLSQEQMFNEKHAERYCQPIIDVLNKPEDALQAFKTAIDIIEASGVDITDKQALKNTSYTEQILLKFHELYPS